MKIKYMVFMGILSFILSSCEKPDFDKLVYEAYNGSLAPEYRERYIIELTKVNILYTTFSPNSTDFELTVVHKVETKIDSTDFKKIKKLVHQLGIIKCKSPDDCDGGGTQTITAYKKGKVVFSNTHYGCGDECSGFYDLLQSLKEYKPNERK